ncbi:MAG: hypothetical protein ACLFPF_07030 [Halanaerobiales bacterium]
MSQFSGTGLLSQLKKNTIELLYINILEEELILYIEEKYLEEFITILKNESIQYIKSQRLAFARIRFNDPEKIMLNINKTVKMLIKYKIPFIELGLSFNRLYIVLANKYKNSFIRLFEEYEE